MNQDVNTERPYVKTPAWDILSFFKTDALKVKAMI